MEAEAQDAAVQARLDRIGALDRHAVLGERASPRELLGELRGLLRDADLPVTPAARGEEVVGRLRTAPHGT